MSARFFSIAIIVALALIIGFAVSVDIGSKDEKRAGIAQSVRDALSSAHEPAPAFEMPVPFDNEERLKMPKKERVNTSKGRDIPLSPSFKRATGGLRICSWTRGEVFHTPPTREKVHIEDNTTPTLVTTKKLRNEDDISFKSIFPREVKHYAGGAGKPSVPGTQKESKISLREREAK